MNADILNNMERINAVAEVLYDKLDNDPKSQALVSIILDYSNVALYEPEKAPLD